MILGRLANVAPATTDLAGCFLQTFNEQHSYKIKKRLNQQIPNLANNTSGEGEITKISVTLKTT